MPGPGGGARGGGGFRGGGSFGGGGFRGGGPRPHHGGGMHRPPYGGMGWFHRPRYYGGGGCLGGLFGLIMMPVVLILVAAVILFSTLGSAFTTLSQGGVSQYDENTFQDYADVQYQTEFGNSTAYEDNILLVFLAEEDAYYDYAYIAWIGDHIAPEIRNMFGESTEFGQAITASVNQSSYKYSLDTDLAQVIQTMEEHIVSAGLTSSFTCQEDHAQVESHLTNRTGMELTESTVNAALQSFTEATGISIVLVVDDITDVFPRKMPASTIAVVVIAVVLIVLAVYLIVRAVRRKRSDDNDSDRKYYDSEGRY